MHWGVPPADGSFLRALHWFEAATDPRGTKSEQSRTGLKLCNPVGRFRGKRDAGLPIGEQPIIQKGSWDG